MDIKDTICLVTGGGGGIGAGLARELHRRGAAHIVVADIDGHAAERVAAEIGGSAIACDVADKEAVERLVVSTEAKHHHIDLVCSNAGILRPDAPHGHAASCSDDDWMRSWAVNVMAHVRLARAALPGMVARQSGGFLITVSAAGLLNAVSHASYAATKHAALGFAESLAITHGDDGIQVSALCPQAVDTDMAQNASQSSGADQDGILSATDVAREALDGLEKNRFLILPHRQVGEYFAHKAANYDRWVGGMRKMRRSIVAGS